MDAWIVSECDAITISLRRSLLRLGIDASPSKVLPTSALDQFLARDTRSAATIFFAVISLQPEHFELLRRLRASTEREVVVVASPPDPATLLKAMRAGATDYLNGDGRLDEEMEDFVERSRSEADQAIHKGRVISVVPCHGPCDGSVLAVNVAAVIAQRLGSCALLDYHLRGGDLALLLKESPRHTIYDLVNEAERIDEAMLLQAMMLHGSGVRLLAGPPMFSDLRGFSNGICQRVLALAQRSHPFVVVNCEDIAHSEQIQSLATSDDILLAIRMDLMSLNRAKQYLDFMIRNRVPSSRLHVVAMGAGSAGELPAKAVQSVLNIAAFHRLPDDQATVTISVNVGNPLVLEAPKSALAKAIYALVDGLAGVEHISSASKASRGLFGRAAAALALNSVY